VPRDDKPLGFLISIRQVYCPQGSATVIDKPSKENSQSVSDQPCLMHNP
jgi:hypothetical protein